MSIRLRSDSKLFAVCLSCRGLSIIYLVASIWLITLTTVQSLCSMNISEIRKLSYLLVRVTPARLGTKEEFVRQSPIFHEKSLFFTPI